MGNYPTALFFLLFFFFIFHLNNFRTSSPSHFQVKYLVTEPRKECKNELSCLKTQGVIFGMGNRLWVGLEERWSCFWPRCPSPCCKACQGPWGNAHESGTPNFWGGAQLRQDDLHDAVRYEASGSEHLPQIIPNILSESLPCCKGCQMRHFPV